MKKSNIILVVTFALTITWTIILGWLGASALNDIANGKTPGYVFSAQQKKVIDIPSSPIPVNELYISAANSVKIKVTTGKQWSIYRNGSGNKDIMVTNKEGKVEIRIQKTDPQLYDLYITLPNISSIRIDSAFELSINHLIQEKLKLEGNALSLFTMDSCKVKTLELGIQLKKGDGDVQFSESTVIDSLTIALNGSGVLRLGTIGKSFNKLWLSEKIKIVAGAGIYQQLNSATISKKGK